MNNCLKSTNESQGHGKSWEIDILCCMGFSHNILNNYKHNERYDGKKEHSPDNRNKSIKTTGKFAPDCGDILRCLNSENTDMVIICYNQEGNYKIVEKTIQINMDSVINLIKNHFGNEEGYNKWSNEIKDYIQCVKDAPKKTKIKDLPCKKSLELPYFGIRPKTDQNRVQCELKLKFILPLLKKDDDYKIEGGAFINGKSYTSKILSSQRERNGITIKKLILFCKEKNIKGYSKYNKDELLKFINDKGFTVPE